jgi:osmotically-inducible protein OsmY
LTAPGQPSLEERGASGGEGGAEAPRLPQEHGALGCLSVDEELQQAVCSALIEQRDLDSTGIGVRVAQGVVVLTGSVRSREELLHAKRIACAQAGARTVETDRLQIRNG